MPPHTVVHSASSPASPRLASGSIAQDFRFGEACAGTDTGTPTLTARHAIVCDPDRDLIRITVAGFFTVADVEALWRDQRDCYRQLRCARNRHLTLADASGMKIQTQEVVAAFSRFANNPATRARRLAVVVGSSLARLQTQRVSEREGMRLFRHLADAEAWLFSDVD